MRVDRTLIALAVIVGVGLAVGLWRVGDESESAEAGDPAALGSVLGSDDADLSGFARVTGPRPFRFPEDHAAHPDYRSEWWYFTGNLEAENSDEFGFQLTFFRFALAPDAPERDSDWATRQVWMAHFAVTDLERGRHYVFERFQRGALGLAGARTGPLRIWLDDWSMTSEDADTLFPLRLRAQADEVAIDLRLTTNKPIVLQGDGGYSAKSDRPGNASHYYSYTRLVAEGSLRVPDGEREVSGTAWLDREWSTSALAADQAGWDWFSLQLDDGRELMVYRLRRDDGGTDPASAGVLVARDGSVQRLAADDFRLTPTAHWTSPESGARYPVDWRVQVPDAGLDLRVEARLDSQEMDTTFRYWEGAVQVRGRGEDAIRGVGYLELTGYAGAREGR